VAAAGLARDIDDAVVEPFELGLKPGQDCSLAAWISGRGFDQDQVLDQIDHGLLLIVEVAQDWVL